MATNLIKITNTVNKLSGFGNRFYIKYCIFNNSRMRHYGLLKKTYVKYGIFMEKQAEIIGWNDMLGSLMYLLIEISKENQVFVQDHEEVEEMKMFNNENQRSCKGSSGYNHIKYPVTLECLVACLITLILTTSHHHNLET
ncbi:unnamed protein product [Rhizophagus irregularis]|nr:unnamed protein product [Rhizophagus irregularis]CAB4409569.1 unnamed protein product [Rhizophagus irregularis]